MQRLVSDQFHLPNEERTTQRATTITSNDGVQSSSEITLEWDPAYQRITLHWLRLRRGGEIIDLAQPERFQILRREKNLQRYQLDGRLTAVAVLEDVRVGDTLEYAYTVRGANPVFGGQVSNARPTQYSSPAGRLEIRVVHAPEQPLRYRLTQPVPPVTSQRLGRLTDLRWSNRQVAEVVLDKNAPSWFEPFGSLEWSTYPDWAAVVQWGRELFAPGELAPELRARVEELRTKEPAEEAQLSAAVALVQDEIRYLGLMMGQGTHRPNAPGEVWRRRYGDCKDKSLLLVAILRQLGFDAAVALVDSEGGRLLKDKLPAPTHFDHAIVCLRWQGKRYWIDGTATHQSTDLRNRTVGHYDLALVLAEGETDLTPVEAPRPRVDSKTITHRLRLPATDQAAELHCEFVYEGESADGVRRYFSTTDSAAIGRRSTEFTQKRYEGAEQVAPPEWKDERGLNRVTVIERYRLPRPLKRLTDGRWRLELFAHTINNAIARPPTSERRAPWAQSWPERIEQRFEVTLPEAFPDDSSRERVEDPAFIFEHNGRQEGKVWRAQYVFETRAETVEPGRIAEYGRNIGRVEDELSWQFTWSPTPTGPAPISGQAPISGPTLLALGCLGLAASVSLGLRRYLRRPVPLEVLQRGEAARLSQLAGFRGWLGLLAFGTLLSPLALAIAVWDMKGTVFNAESWQQAASTPWVRPIYAITALGTTLEVVGGLTLVYALIRQHYRFPALCIAMMLLSFATLAVDYGLLHLLSDIASEVYSEALGHLIRAVLFCLLWIPYLLRSKRVAGTFVRDSHVPHGSMTQPPPLPSPAPAAE